MLAYLISLLSLFIITPSFSVWLTGNIFQDSQNHTIAVISDWHAVDVARLQDKLLNDETLNLARTQQDHQKAFLHWVQQNADRVTVAIEANYSPTEHFSPAIDRAFMMNESMTELDKLFHLLKRHNIKTTNVDGRFIQRAIYDAAQFVNDDRLAPYIHLLDEKTKAVVQGFATISYSDFANEVTTRIKNCAAAARTFSNASAIFLKIAADLQRVSKEAQEKFAYFYRLSATNASETVMPWDSLIRNRAGFKQFVDYINGLDQNLDFYLGCSDGITLETCLQAKNEQRSAVAIVGFLHAQRIEESLKQLGYKKIGDFQGQNQTLLEQVITSNDSARLHEAVFGSREELTYFLQQI